jgi:adenosylcobinamide-phosphate synthase
VNARALALVAGFGADLVVGDPRRWHPVAGFGRLATVAERVLWRDDRAAGVGYAVVCAGAPAALAWVVDRALARRGAGLARAGLLAALTWAAVGGRSLGREAAGIARCLEAGDLDGARERLPALVGRDPAGLGEAELCRAVCESVAENTADAVAGPLVWGAVLGSPGVVLYRCANTLDAMVGHRGPRYGRFGWASARLDDLLTWPAARLTAWLAAVCAPLVGGSPKRALATAGRDGAGHPSPNAGPVEAAFAGALGVRLGGTNVYPDGAGGTRTETRGPLGDGPPPGPADVARTVRLSRAIGAGAALLAGAAAWGVRSLRMDSGWSR